MCGISGIAGRDEAPLPTPNDVIAMMRLTGHRGPDGMGLWGGGDRVTAADADELTAQSGALPRARVWLGQSRLAITGTSDALQPFTSADGRLALAHNGEIYNHADLAMLANDANPEAPRSDSETLLHVLECHYAATEGDLAESMRRTMRSIGGMYAIAVTDGRTTVLARDPVGKKPLYYVAGPDRFAYASERKALGDLARDQDRRIQRLPPGHLLVCPSDLRVRSEAVESLTAPAIDIHDEDAAVAEYRRALEAAIARRVQGLERAAVLFSGGVDSVLIAQLLVRAGVDVTGYVSGVADSSDVRYALRVAEDLGLRIRVTPVDESALEDELPKILKHTELHGPLMAEVSIPMWFAARAAHEDGHRVIFTGQAADELFAGYTWYPKVVQEQGHLTLHARMWEDLCRLPLDTLEREDRITMAWALEMRAPYLDEDVIRAAFRIAPHVKLHDPEDRFGKHPHRVLAEQMGVPHAVAWRLKEPAQDGANVHELLQRVARRRFPEGAPATEAPPDFGSNYRYRDELGHYATAEVHALLQQTVRRGGFVVAHADGSASAPPAAPVPPVLRPARRTPSGA